MAEGGEEVVVVVVELADRSKHIRLISITIITCCYLIIILEVEGHTIILITSRSY